MSVLFSRVAARLSFERRERRLDRVLRRLCLALAMLAAIGKPLVAQTNSLTVTIGGNGSGTVSSSPAGINCVSTDGVTSGTCTANFPVGILVTLTATPAQLLPATPSDVGTMVGVGCTAQTHMCGVALSPGANTVAVTFVALGKLSIVTAGTGTGVVTGANGGLLCNRTSAGATTGFCTIYNAPGSVQPVFAQPDPGSTFTGWGGACSGTGACSVTLAGQQTVIANFSLPSATITIATSGGGSGVVVSSPAGINCTITAGVASGPCSASFPIGWDVSLSEAHATSPPGSPSDFVGWSGGGCGGTANSCLVHVAQAAVVTAAFNPRPTLSVTLAGTGAGSVAGGAAIACVLSVGGVNSGICSTYGTLGATIPLSATPAAGSAFIGWSGACTGTGPCSPTLDAPKGITATFGQQLSVAIVGQGTVASSPAGISCVGTGSATTGTCATPTAGPTTLTATPTGAWTFGGWSGACTGSAACTATGGSVTATFLPPPTRTVTVGVVGHGKVNSTPSGIACVEGGAACTGTFASGGAVTLAAVPDPGWTLATWGGACAGAAGCVLPASTNAQSVTATFVPAVQTVLVAGSGTGSGTVTSSPAGIRCTIVAGVTTGSCYASYTIGTVVTMTTTPDVGSSAAGCAPASCSVTVDVGSSAVIVTFARLLGTVRVGGAGGGSGTVKSVPAGIDCTIAAGSPATAGCVATFPLGTAVTLTAAPTGGTPFSGWSGGCTAAAATCTVTVSTQNELAVTAAFGAKATLTVAGAGDGSGVVTASPGTIACRVVAGSATGDGCVADYTPGTAVMLVATPEPGSRFTGWTGATCPGVGPCQLSMDRAATVAATFARVATLAIAPSGIGSGAVTSQPAGIQCTVTAGVAKGGACEMDFPIGTSVTLTAAPAAGQLFVGWTGSACAATTTMTSCVVSLARSETIGVSFAALPTPTVAAADLLAGASLTTAERTLLDQLGNRDGTYNLGDLLALLDRTGKSLSDAAMAQLLALPPGFGRALGGDAKPRTCGPDCPSVPR